MEQLYLVEIMLDKVSIFVDENNESSTASKNIICKVKFGPKMELILKEDVQKRQDDVVYLDERGNRKYTRTLRQGKSVLFPSYPDIMLQVLQNFPLAVEVFNDDANEDHNIYVAGGRMLWDPEFYVYLKETADVHMLHEPLALKTTTVLRADHICKQCGEISFIVRICPLGESVITEFVELSSDCFVFATDKASTRFKCQRRVGDDINFTMVGCLYETVTLEDPDVVKGATTKIDVCTKLESCGVARSGDGKRCTFEYGEIPQKYPIDKIRMGDIRGPCGNTNCNLAQKVKMYIRTLDTYKKLHSDQPKPATEANKDTGDNKDHSCGACICVEEKWHRKGCPDKEEAVDQKKCKNCGAFKTKQFECELKDSTYVCSQCKPPTPKDSKTNPPNTNETTPKGSKTKPPSSSETTPKDSKTKPPSSPETTPKDSKTVNYVTNVTRDPELMKSMFGKDFISYNLSVTYDFKASGVQGQESADPELLESIFEKDFVVHNVSVKYDFEDSSPNKSCGKDLVGCGTDSSKALALNTAINKNMNSGNKTADFCFNQTETLVYNAGIGQRPFGANNNVNVYNCLQLPDDKECRCQPIKPTPPCKTTDCQCIQNLIAEKSRKLHKSYCPLYKHRTTCPVLKMDDENKVPEEDEEEAALPYGLPPVHLGPCPVMGRPCSVPDGYARMYKVAAMSAQPASYSDAGKICCSKEFERIRNAIKEYMKNDKPSDFRCINKFNVDTEKRCCDKENVRKSLLGKDCCGAHKMEIQEQYKHTVSKPGTSTPNPSSNK